MTKNDSKTTFFDYWNLVIIWLLFRCLALGSWSFVSRPSLIVNPRLQRAGCNPPLQNNKNFRVIQQFSSFTIKK